MRRAGEGTSIPLVLPGRRGGHLERCTLVPVLPSALGRSRAPAAAREPPGWEWEAAEEKSAAEPRAARAA